MTSVFKPIKELSTSNPNTNTNLQNWEQKYFFLTEIAFNSAVFVVAVF